MSGKIMALFKDAEQISVWVSLSYTEEPESQKRNMASVYGVRTGLSGRSRI